MIPLKRDGMIFINYRNDSEWTRDRDVLHIGTGREVIPDLGQSWHKVRHSNESPHSLDFLKR